MPKNRYNQKPKAVFEMAQKPEQNKQNAVAFYDLMFNQCQPAEAIEKYVGAEYK